MSGRTRLNILLLASLLVVGIVAEVAAEGGGQLATATPDDTSLLAADLNAATNPVPADGAVATGSQSGTSVYMMLDYSPGGGAVSHTGYFSDKYDDVAGRDPAHSLGFPPYPSVLPTAFLVGFDDAAIPAFARVPLEQSKTYYWAVDEFDGQTTWPGEVWSFTVMPEKAWNPDPPDGARDVIPDPGPTLTWMLGDVDMSGDIVVTYDLYYGTVFAHVNTSTTPNHDVATTSYTAGPFMKGATYYWRIDTRLTSGPPLFEIDIIKGDVWQFETFGGPRIIYVDADAVGANDGSSWENAYNCLQDAFTDANSSPKPLEILVAQGTYRPDESTLHPYGTGDREATFQLINGVTIKGGFAGFGEPDPNARDIALYETILSGDLDANDVDVNDPADLLREPTRAENSYHVVTGSWTDETAVVDGFTITGGNANGSNESRCGGGMYNRSCWATVNNCIFTGNSAAYNGGGMYNREGSSPTLTNCTLSSNSTNVNSPASHGGGMYNCEGSGPTLTNCIFSNNSAGGGGGMYNEDSRPMLTNCTFIGNSARAVGAGGIRNNKSNPTLTNCTFSGNSARDKGGGMYNGSSSPILVSCIFSKNFARRDGGGIRNYKSNPTLTNCIFNGNWSGTLEGAGGGMANSDSDLTITNCTFAGNSAPMGNGLACDSYKHSYPSNLRVTNCILRDGGDEIWNNDGSTITITYSDVEDGWPGEGNIDEDPLLEADGYHLSPGSPCINEGTNTPQGRLPETDIDGEARVMLGRVDMGADEFNPFKVEFDVVEKRRIGRTVFEYDCEVTLQNVSRFTVKNIQLTLANASDNMTIIQPNVTFGDTEVGPGESTRSIDTCTFSVDRSQAIDPAKIIWQSTCELTDTGQMMSLRGSSVVSLRPIDTGEFDFGGLTKLADKWLWTGPPGQIEEDVVPDGRIDLADFAEFARKWGRN